MLGKQLCREVQHPTLEFTLEKAFSFPVTKATATRHTPGGGP